jgi:hypothetical protein
MPIKEVVKEHGGNTVVVREQVGIGTAGVWQFDLPAR